MCSLLKGSSGGLQTCAMPTSSVLSEAKSLLTKLAVANRAMERDREGLERGDYNMEIVNQEDRHIAMVMQYCCR